jgi:hypothetical protein
MLDFLDEDNPDDIRFGFMKKLCLGIMSDDERDRASVLEQQHLSVACTFTSGKVLVRLGTHRLLSEADAKLNARPWRENIARASGLIYHELCLNSEDGLVEEAPPAGTTIHPRNCRLTPLGERVLHICNEVWKFCS